MKMNQILSAALISTAMTTAAMAEHGKMTGFYVGVNGGYGVGHGDMSSLPARTTLNSSDYGLGGFVGGLHTGYQKDFGCMVAGLELAGNLSNTDGDDKTFTNKLTFERKNAFGAAARLGFKLNTWLVYAKLGYENAKFKVSSAVSSSKRHNAFVPGLGMETMLTSNVMFGGEWTYAMYNKKTYAISVATGGETRASFKPRVGDFKLRLGYKF